MSSITQEMQGKGYNGYRTILTNAALAGLGQSFATYPLTTMSVRNLSNAPISGRLFGGFTIECLSRSTKSIVSATILYRFHKLHFSENKIIQASTAGALSGIIEAGIVNPLTVWKNHCQTSENKPKEIARMLAVNDLYRGVIATAIRNGLSSFISIGGYAALTSPEDHKVKQLLIGGTAMVLGGLSTTSLEALRVSQVMGCKPQPYLQALKSSFPGLVKLCVMGITIGPTLHKILYDAESKSVDH